MAEIDRKDYFLAGPNTTPLLSRPDQKNTEARSSTEEHGVGLFEDEFSPCSSALSAPPCLPGRLAERIYREVME